MDTEQILAALRVALAPDATPEHRAAGAAAARAILATLEPSTPPPVASAASGMPPNLQALAAMFAQLRGLPPEQLLDVAIARLRAALPSGATAPAPVGAYNVRLVGVPFSASKGGS